MRKRISEKKFNTYEDAKAFASQKPAGVTVDKTKIFARWDGTYDVVRYKNEEKKAS